MTAGDPGDSAADDGGWSASAAAWIADLSDQFGRLHVLDAPMLARVRRGGFASALDVGCGEGRFCRMLRDEGVAAIGIDPTDALLAEARRRDPGGDYRHGRAVALDFPDGHFDLVVSHLSLIDIPDLDAGVAEMARVLAPGGALLIANLNPFLTASNPDGGEAEGADGLRFGRYRYFAERGDWVEWRGIRIRNWHRTMAAYMAALLGHGLTLAHFSEPAPSGGPPDRIDRYRRMPWFHIMEWRKPAAAGAQHA